MIIGIDPGTKTGFAVWDTIQKKFLEIETMKIHQAMDSVLEYHNLYGRNLYVRFEDARQRKWFGSAGHEQLQGAGSIKRDCAIWEDFLTDNQIDFDAVPPKKNITKLNSDTFQKIAKWNKRTSNHARDAAMLIINHP